MLPWLSAAIIWLLAPAACLGLFMALRKQWKKSTWGVVNAMTIEGAAALDEAQTP